MNGTRFLRRLALANFLSYGPQGESVDLLPLNVIIGPNGSGKSNLIEAIGILNAAPSSDLTQPIREGGGMPEWPFKGSAEASPPLDFTIDADVAYSEGLTPLRYSLQVVRSGQRLEILNEAIENTEPTQPGAEDVCSFYRNQWGTAVLSVRTDTSGQCGSTEGRTERQLRREELSSEQSVLSQRKDPDQYPELTFLAESFQKIAMFRECHLGRRSPLRGPQRADHPDDFLLPDGANLGLILNGMLNRPPLKRDFLKRLKRFYPHVEDIAPIIRGNTIETFFHESGFFDPTPSTRLSDGTLRFLALLAIFCHPSPPPLICIEDPETGLHPDILPMVAELMVEASQRSQVIATTHSDVIVSALSDQPESVLVCERDDDGSHLRRLDPSQLNEWLDNYTLGELWRMGETGGNPW